jgi:SAM-dependent methyltransferase
MEQVAERVLDETRLNTLLGKMITELGAAANGALILIGDKLDLYKTLAKEGPLTSEELAQASGTSERYIREWLSAQAASGYIEYDKEAKKFYMLPEQTAVLGDENSPALMTGGFYSVSSIYHDEPKLAEAFKTGQGVSWEDHNNCLFCGVEKFFRPSYKSSLLQSWLPALDGVIDKLKEGIKVADVGCGHGISTLILAEAFPNSYFIGYDFHEKSIEHAREIARKSELKNISFEVADAKSYPQTKYSLITFFDCLHDMGDPVGAAQYALNALDENGSCMIIEPFAHDELHENFNPLGRAYYAFSTAICTPNALSQDYAFALGSQAGKKRITDVLLKGGFGNVKVALETPFNFIFEAKR